MDKDILQQRMEQDELMIEIPISLLFALLNGTVRVEMKSISLGEYLEKEIRN